MEKQIRMAIVYAGSSCAAVADALGMSRQSFSGRLSRDRWACDDLAKIADILGCEFSCEFKFSDGKII
jgi:hypothetical protein